MTTGLARYLSLVTRASLAVLVAGAVIGVILVTAQSRPEPVEPPASALKPVAVTPPEVEAVPGGALVERPLFWESRRPYTAPEPVAGEQPTPGSDAIDKIKLVGVFASGIRAGVIVDIEGERRRIGLNEEVQGWQLTGMTPGSATFAGVGRDGNIVERRLVLQHAGAGGEAVPAARTRFAPADGAGGDSQQDDNVSNDESNGDNEPERKSDE